MTTQLVPDPTPQDGWSECKRTTWHRYIAYHKAEGYYRERAQRARNPDKITELLLEAEAAHKLAQQTLTIHQECDSRT